MEFCDWLHAGVAAASLLPLASAPFAQRAEDAKPAELATEALATLLRPATGKPKLSADDLYKAYAATSGGAVVGSEAFVEPVKMFCDAAGIRTIVSGQRVYLLGVHLLGVQLAA